MGALKTIADGVGWERPATANKFHCYTLDGRSLCGKYAVLFKIEAQRDASEPGQGECAGCRRKLDAFNARAAKAALSATAQGSGGAGA